MKSHATWILHAVLLFVVGTPGFSAEPDEGHGAAVAAIEKLGGFVKFDKNKAVVEVNLLGDERLNDTSLKHLKGLTDLRRLYLVNMNFTDAGQRG